MFAAVMITPQPSRLTGRIGQMLRRPRPSVRRLRRDAASYWLITAPSTGRGVDWELVGDCAGRQRRRLVVDPSIELPEDAGIARFEPNEFPFLLAFNAAKSALQHSRVELWKRTVGVVDPEGRCQNQVMELLSYATCVKVCTQRPERYEAFCRQMLALYGAPVLVCRDEEPLNDCLLVVSAAPRPLGLDQNLPVIGAKSGGAAPLELWDFACELPGEYQGFAPEGMDPTYFLAALYELGHRKALGKTIPTACRMGGRKVALGELGLVIQARSGAIARWQGQFGY